MQQMPQMGGLPPNHGMNPMAGIPNQIPQHIQQQQLQQMQANNAGQMFMGQGVGNIPGVGMTPGPMSGGPRPPFNIAGNQMGPLAFLEKTTSNIDMGDGRR